MFPQCHHKKLGGLLCSLHVHELRKCPFPHEASNVMTEGNAGS